MSLKHFHIAFITISVMCTLGFAAWALLMPNLTSDIRGLGWFSGILSLALGFYGFFFLKKLKQMVL